MESLLLALARGLDAGAASLRLRIVRRERPHRVQQVV